MLPGSGTTERRRESLRRKGFHLSQKHVSFCDINTEMETVDDKILKAMGAVRFPKTFTLAELSNCGRPDAVRQAISRMVRAGGVRRIRPGLYDLPKTHPIIGTTAPDLEATVKAIMQRSNAKWQFSGAYAANLLGLSEQVPAKVVIITDGVARNIAMGRMTLSFRRVAPRNLLGVGTTAGLVFQALRYIGSKSPDLERHATRLRRMLDENTKSDLVRLTPKMPVWMQGVVRSITREKKNG
jgi:hypothetical protein